MGKRKYFNGRSDLPALPPDGLNDRMNDALVKTFMICSETNAQSTPSFVSLHCKPTLQALHGELAVGF